MNRRLLTEAGPFAAEQRRTPMTFALPKLRHHGRILLLGCGSVSQCLQPLLLRHLDMDFARLTVMDMEDLAGTVPETLASGARYVRTEVTAENLDSVLGGYLGDGDLLINLSWSAVRSHACRCRWSGGGVTTTSPHCSAADGQRLKMA